MDDTANSAGLERRTKANERLRKGLEYLTALALCILILVTITDVFGRYVLNSPLPGAFEYVRALMAIVTFAALPLVCGRNEHLRAGILDHMISPRVSALREPFVQLLSAVVLAGITWRLWAESQAKWISKGILSGIDLPLWIPIAFMTIMCAAATIVTLSITLATTRAALDQ